MLNDVKNVEYGESYKDKKTYRTLGQLKTGKCRVIKDRRIIKLMKLTWKKS